MVVDSTGSMDSYLYALQRFIPQLLALQSIASTSPNNGRIGRIGILSYTDYYTPPIINPSQTSVANPVPANDAAAKALIPRLTVDDVLNWSGWVDWNNSKGGGDVLIEWTKGLTAEGGGDYPEAAKTALKFLMNRVLDKPRGEETESSEAKEELGASSEEQPERDTIVLWYTDSAPHHRSHRGINRLLEIAAHNPPPSSNFPTLATLISKESLGTAINLPAPHPEPSSGQKTTHNHGEACTDWVHLCLAAKEARLKVYTILPPNTADSDASFWVMLGEITKGGTCATGGRLTDSGNIPESGTQVPSGYIVGGGDFMRIVMNLSTAIVLNELGARGPFTSSGAWKGKDRVLNKPNATMSQNELSKIKGARWLSYQSDNIHEFLPEDNSRPHLPAASIGQVSGSRTPLATTIPAQSTEEMALDTMSTAPPGSSAEPVRPETPGYIDRNSLRDEDDWSQGFLPGPWRGAYLWASGSPKRGIRRESTESSALGSRIANSISLTLKDLFIETAREDEAAYWDTVMVSLKGVVNADAESLSTVKVFSEVWTTINQRSPSSARAALFSAYTSQVSDMKNADKRETLLRWADMNNDASSEVTRLLQNCEGDERSSAGDPEMSFLTMDEEAFSELSLSREQLLALTTSCDRKTLKNAGDLLRYTRSITPNELPSGNEHISLHTTPPAVLFRVLPHLLLPGTLYSPRTASVLAIVAITANIPHLLVPARLLLESTKGTWINAATPENFSPQFIALALSVPLSRIYLLSQEESEVYQGMARYTRLEDNIDTKIQAKVPWTPMKTRGVGDRKRLCDGCGIRRSETMMHQVGTYVFGNMKAEKEQVEKECDEGMRCGMCVDSDTKNPKDWKDRGEIESCWVECSERWCRAQYVIEDEEALRIPPRCYYCRKRKPAPWIECTRCANRIILPRSYRVLPADSPSQFVCPPCQNAGHTGHKSIVHKLTTLRSLLFANDYEVGWLEIRPFKEIFRSRSTFVIWELYGNEIFKSLVPSTTPSPPLSPSVAMEKRKRLLLNGKKLLNPQELKEELQEIVERSMRNNKILCGLTFDYFDEKDVTRACGNAGCDFVASRSGIQEWYSGNGERRKRCPSCNRPSVDRT